MNTMKFLATAGVVLSSALAMAETENVVRFANEWDQVLEEEIVTAVPVENANTDVAAFKVTDMEEVWRIKNNPVDMEEVLKVRENPVFASALRANEGRANVKLMPEESQAKMGMGYGLDLAKKDFGKEAVEPFGAVLTSETGMPNTQMYPF